MSWLTPASGLFGLTLPVIAAVYLLRVRRPDVTLSSTLLWRRAVRDRQASVPWQRLRASWLLLLQLLAAALIVLALVRPAVATSSDLAGQTIVIVDISAPMGATDVSPNRFEVAKAQARDLVDQLGAGARMTVIAMGPRPRVVAANSTDQGTLRTALSTLQLSNGAADLGNALALASAAAGAASDVRLVVISDGVVSPLHSPLQLPFAVEYRRVGQSGENLAITALSITSDPGSRAAVVHVQNLGRQAQHTSVELRVDDRLVDARAVSLDSGQGRDVEFPLPQNADRVVARLTPTDLLPLDDVAYAVARQPRTFKVALVTHRDVFLERALRLRSDFAVSVVDPAAYRPDAATDLTVLDGYLPASLPNGPLLIAAPPKDARLGTGDFVNPGALRAALPGDPLLSDVDLSDVHVARTRTLGSSTFGRAVIDSAAGPVLMARDGTPRQALFAFDLHESDLPLRPAFPLLIDRIAAFLVPEAVPPRSHAAGDVVPITAPPGAAAVRVFHPDGRVESLGASGGSIGGDDTDAVGMYGVEIDRGGRTDRSAFAVDSLDPLTSSIAPHSGLDLAGSAGAPPAPRGNSRLAELWPWLALVALAVLTAEWLVYHRGI